MLCTTIHYEYEYLKSYYQYSTKMYLDQAPGNHYTNIHKEQD